jgi:O-antigen ligase
MGLVGLVLYLALHLALARVLWKRARAGSVMAAGALLSWVGFQVLGLVHYPQFHTGVMLSFALAWGLGLAPSERREPA